MWIINWDFVAQQSTSQVKRLEVPSDSSQAELWCPFRLSAPSLQPNRKLWTISTLVSMRTKTAFRTKLQDMCASSWLHPSRLRFRQPRLQLSSRPKSGCRNLFRNNNSSSRRSSALRPLWSCANSSQFASNKSFRTFNSRASTLMKTEFRTDSRFSAVASFKFFRDKFSFGEKKQNQSLLQIQINYGLLNSCRLWMYYVP